MSRRGLSLAAALLACGGCLADRLGDGLGYACSRDADCPAPYACVALTCQTRPALTRAVVVAAGGIACDPGDPDFNLGQGTSKVCRMADTAALAREQGPDAIFALGDLQLTDGTAEKFSSAYARSWGAADLAPLTFPVAGEAEHRTAGAAGLRATFPRLADAGTWYAFDLGPWRIIALDTACGDPAVKGCGPESAQGRWLAAELAAHPGGCSAALMSMARFSSSYDGSAVQPLWQQLAAGGVDLVLAAGDAHFERFAPLDADGQPSDAGTVSFVVGTGGARLGDVMKTAPFSQNVGVSHGVLRLELETAGYRWRFVAVSDVPLDDHGEGRCH
ncbi:MAG: hypothetical protein IPJ65_23200 [Archangiaceae bacterium]|nr:hypothetical protein [Archangiaceae bacterium]